MSEYRPIRVALLGAGSVGAEVARLLLEQSAELKSRVGAELELVGVLVRDTNVKREGFPKNLLTTDAESLILGADIVIEVMGGIDPAREYILMALNSGADVITANKFLIATHGTELFSVAEQVGAQLYFEAAVAAAIPIIRPLKESLAGDRVTRILGIVNGSTNYILDRMDKDGISLSAAMEEATALGYLEADPTLDIDGYDAAQKAAILATLAFHTEVPLEKVYREGISSISVEQIAAAKRDGYVIKLLAICEFIEADKTGPEGVSVRVYPALIPRTHPLAAVNGAYNAVFVEAEAAGSLMFYGSGAGGTQPRPPSLVMLFRLLNAMWPVVLAWQTRATRHLSFWTLLEFKLAIQFSFKSPTNPEFLQRLLPCFPTMECLLKWLSSLRVVEIRPWQIWKSEPTSPATLLWHL